VKFLVDNQLPPALAHYFRKRGFDCEHVLDVGLAQASDTEICRYAESHERDHRQQRRGFSLSCQPIQKQNKVPLGAAWQLPDGKFAINV